MFSYRVTPSTLTNHSCRFLTRVRKTTETLPRCVSCSEEPCLSNIASETIHLVGTQSDGDVTLQASPLPQKLRPAARIMHQHADSLDDSDMELVTVGASEI
jgi:hypothetical protein